MRKLLLLQHDFNQSLFNFPLPNNLLALPHISRPRPPQPTIPQQLWLHSQQILNLNILMWYVVPPVFRIPEPKPRIQSWLRVWRIMRCRTPPLAIVRRRNLLPVPVSVGHPVRTREDEVPDIPAAVQRNLNRDTGRVE